MTVALLFALALTALSGMATLAGIVTSASLPAWAEEDDEHGEHGEGSGEGLEEIHGIAANATLLLILLHVAGVEWASRAHGENLVRAMIDGRKRRSE
jgi:cytochrome b